VRISFCLVFLLLRTSLAALPRNLPADIIEIGQVDDLPSNFGVEILQTGGATLSLEEVEGPGSQPQWRAMRNESEAFGFTESEVWIRFVLRNSARSTGSAILELRSPRLDRADVYELRSHGVQKLSGGDTIEGLGDAMGDRNPAFRIEMQGQETLPLYVRLTSRDPLEAAPRILSESNYDRSVFRGTLFIGAYFGAILLMCLANGILYFASRDRTFLLYALYLAFVTLLLAGLTGVMRALFPLPLLVNEGAIFTSFFVAVLLISFIREFLKTPLNLPRLDIGLKFALVSCFPQLMILFVSGYRAALIYVHAHGAILAIFVLVIGVVAIRKNLDQSKLFFLGWIVLYGSLIIEGLARALIIPHTTITGNGFVIGVVIEAFIFSLALGFRMRRFVATRESERTRMRTIENEMELARRSQEALLPRSAPSIPGLSVQASYIPFLVVGGDFYAYNEINPRKLGILVADVAGHGLSAALDSSVVRIAFHHAVSSFVTTSDVLLSMNEFLHSYVDYRYVSAIYAVFDLERGTMETSSAGHPPLMVSHAATGQIDSIITEGPLLGLNRTTKFEQKTIPLNQGDRVILYTDGLYERLIIDHPELDQGALVDLFAKSLPGPAATLADRLLSRLSRMRVGPPSDDITLVVVDFQAITEEKVVESKLVSA